MKKFLTKQNTVVIILVVVGVFLIGSGVLAYQQAVKLQAETIEENSKNAIDVCEKRLTEISGHGVKTDNQQILLEQAKKESQNENYKEAKEKANQARLKAEELYREQLEKD